MIDCDAYILVGGRSSRLGRDKALVDIGGKTLAQRSYDVVSNALPDSRVTFVAAYEAQFAIEAILAGGRFIFDIVPGRGPLGGLHSALSDAATEWIFILACDYPFISSEMIALLRSKISDHLAAVVPVQSDGRLQPLCAFYKTQPARGLVQELIDRPRVPPPLTEIVLGLNPATVNSHEYSGWPDSDRFFININSGPDLDLAREIERKLSSKIEIK